MSVGQSVVYFLVSLSFHLHFLYSVSCHPSVFICFSSSVGHSAFYSVCHILFSLLPSLCPFVLSSFHLSSHTFLLALLYSSLSVKYEWMKVYNFKLLFYLCSFTYLRRCCYCQACVPQVHEQVDSGVAGTEGAADVGPPLFL